MISVLWMSCGGGVKRRYPYVKVKNKVGELELHLTNEKWEWELINPCVSFPTQNDKF